MERGYFDLADDLPEPTEGIAIYAALRVACSLASDSPMDRCALGISISRRCNHAVDVVSGGNLGLGRGLADRGAVTAACLLPSIVYRFLHPGAGVAFSDHGLASGEAN